MSKTGSVRQLALRFGFLAAFVYTGSAVAGDAELIEDNELFSMSLEELLDVEVSSVSKKTEKVFNTAAAVFVISQTDIKRSGATSIPEALRMAPGVDVAKIDANKWAISSRGFTGRFSNKLLVLIDGRSVYTPFFSGVYWDVQDTLLEDIERIEVIRGSGASLWGANAVNGVINIITKNAADSQGNYLTAGGGSKERVFGGGRHGGKIDEDVYYRVYAKYFERENNDDYLNRPVNDDWRMGRGGFRVDGSATARDQYTVQGDFYNGEAGETVLLPDESTVTNRLLDTDTQLAGGNWLMRWNRQLNRSDDFQLQVYYDYAERDSAWIRHEHNTLDLDFQHRFAAFDTQELIWGGGYRFISDDIEGTDAIKVDQSQRDVHLFNLFVQDEITVIEDTLKLIFGSKFEHNDFSGVEIQPNARFIWTPHQQHAVWGSISRAVRTPARGERGLEIHSTFSDDALPQQNVIFADVGRNAEELIAYELGYRFKPFTNFSADLALFYNDYDKLRSVQPGSGTINRGTYTIIPLYFANNMKGESYGAELDLVWQVMDTWRLSGNYSYQNQELHVIDGSRFSEHEERHTLNHKFSVRSSLDLLPNLGWDLWFKYAWTEDVHEHSMNEPLIKHLNDLLILDTRLSWSPVPQVELSVVGQNLLNTRQFEYFSDFINTSSSAVERSVYGQIEWRF